MGGHAGLILIADGDPRCASTMRDALRADPHDVVVVHDGASAIAELHGAEFDVVILDLELTAPRAFDVISAAQHLSPDSEVIVVARRADLESAVACLRLGICDLLDKTKETDGDSLRRAVSRAIERRRLRDATALVGASQEIFASGDAEKLPATIVDITARVLEADDVALGVPAGGGALRLLYSKSLSAETRIASSEELGKMVAERVSELGVPILLPEDASKIGPLHMSRVHSAIVFPLMSGERRIGVLTVSRIGDPRPYRRADIERASVLASQALLAVENASLVRKSLEAERLATIGQLAAGVAHEINNPLTYILASGRDAREAVQEVLRASPPGAATASLLLAQDALADVCDGGERIAEIARDLRTLARGNAPSRETIDLADAIRSAARIAGPRVRETALLDLDLATGTRLSGHAGRLTQVFVNLIVNAAQAGGSPAKRAHISVATRISGAQVIATVKDDGPGIAPEHLDLLFVPFFSTKSSSNGTGLGLSLTQSIVSEHGGTIGVTSELGRGAMFTLTFPLSVVPLAKEESGVMRRPARVVIVHRDPVALRAFARWFGRDYDILGFESADAARTYLRERTDTSALVCEKALRAELAGDAKRIIVVDGALDYETLRGALSRALANAA